MTLPTTGSLSLSDVLTELKIANPSRTAPISLGDADVLALAGKSAPPISLSDLYGKSGIPPVVVTGHGDSNSVTSAVGTQVACHPSATYTGGNGAAPSYFWEFVTNPNGCAISNQTSQTCTVTHAYTTNSSGSASATLKCTVTTGPVSGFATGIPADLSWTP